MATTDLISGTLMPPNRADFHTKQTGFSPRQMPTPLWDKFLTDTLGGNTEMVAYLQRLAGYSCSGAQDYHVLPFLHGTGRNGKSVFLDVMLGALGGYGSGAPAQFLLSGRQVHETEIANLKGMRFVVCSEVNQNDKFDEAKIKLLTGGDKLTARYLHRDYFTFAPTHHLWLMGNHQPRVESGGEAFWRRLRLIPFTHVVALDKMIPDLAGILLAAEGPGILQWVIDGAVDVFNNGGLRDPEMVLAATAQYAEEEDPTSRFFADRCFMSSAAKTDTTRVRAAYIAWCAENGERPLSPQQFAREARTRHLVAVVKSHGRRFFAGLDLVAGEAAELSWLAP